MAGGSGSRAKSARARRSHSRSRCAMANELILVIEDNEQNRKLVRDVLTFKGYEIIEAETGEEGLRLASARGPKLVLMDIRLPGIRRDRGARTAPRGTGNARNPGHGQDGIRDDAGPAEEHGGRGRRLQGETG